MLENNRSSVRTILESLRTEFQTRAFLASEFPMIAEWGVEDYGLTVHSLGLNYLSAFGRSAGYWSVTEFPLVTNTAPASRCIRSDVVWFEKPDGEIALLGEFERADAAGKLDAIRSKAENLLFAHHSLGVRPRVLLLALWTTDGRPSCGMRELITHVRCGFRDQRGNRVPGLPSDSKFMVATFLFGRGQGGYRLREVLL